MKPCVAHCPFEYGRWATSLYLVMHEGHAKIIPTLTDRNDFTKWSSVVHINGGPKPMPRPLIGLRSIG